MAKAHQASYEQSHTEPKSYAKRMCNNVAIALVVYTLNLIFVTSPAMEGGMSILPYFILVLLVGIAIPYLRGLEHRWRALEKSELSASGLNTRYRMDQVTLWALAVGVPVGLYFLIRAVF